MQHLADVVSTFGAAALGSLLYLVQRQRPQHRPFGRDGWRYTLAATAWLAAVTTVATYAVTTLSSGLVPSPVLAFAAPIGAGGVRAVSQRRAGDSASAQAGESAPLQQLLTLGLPVVLDWLDQHLADVKQRQIDAWHRRLRSDRAVRTLIRRFHARLAERRLAGTRTILRRLNEREELYAEVHEQSQHRDADARRRLRVERDIAIDDVLRLVYEARADVLLNQPTPTRPRDRARPPAEHRLPAMTAAVAASRANRRRRSVPT